MFLIQERDLLGSFLRVKKGLYPQISLKKNAIWSCRTRQLLQATWRQPTAMKALEPHAYFSSNVLQSPIHGSGIVRHCLKNMHVVLKPSLQLVASKLPAKVASCDMTIWHSFLMKFVDKDLFSHGGRIPVNLSPV